MRFVRQTMVGFAVMVAASAASAVEYTSMNPLEQELASSSIRDCRGGEGVNVPVITWGGDMVTIYANGNNLQTQAGSVFADEGLSVTLKREDVFTKQVEAYLACKTPYMRGTQGQVNLAAGLTEKDSRTQMVTIYQHSWSNGGDALVVRGDIKKPADLKGKTIGLQANGPHVAYLFKVLKDAGLELTDVNLKFTKDLVGFDDDTTPGTALLDDNKVDAACVLAADLTFRP